MITLKNILDVAEATFKVAAAKGYSVNKVVTFAVNPRLNSSLGVFKVKKTELYGVVSETMSIDISGRFTEVGEQFIDTVRHEIAHFIAYIHFGDLSHGPKWKKIASDLGAVPKSYVMLTDNDPVAPAKVRQKRLVIRARCVCCPKLYRPKKEQKIQIQSGLIPCPKCKVKKLYLVKV